MTRGLRMIAGLEGVVCRARGAPRLEDCIEVWPIERFTRELCAGTAVSPRRSGAFEYDRRVT